MSTLAQPQNAKPSHFIHANPVINKLNKIDERDEANACTYRGITRKLVFFLVMVAAGIAVSAMLKLSGFQFAGSVVYENPELGVVITQSEAVVLGICAVLFILTPLLAVFIRPTIPVTGALYCFATGYILAWLAGTFGKEYEEPIWLALVLTVLLVLVMGFLYGRGIVKVNNKFRSIMTTLFITVVAGGVLVFIASLIPATRPFVAALQGNLVLSVGGGIVLVIIGALFLLVDFDTIKTAVEEQLPKKYEWYASFGLAFSVIWIYFKILDIILRITQAGKSQS